MRSIDGVAETSAKMTPLLRHGGTKRLIDVKIALVDELACSVNRAIVASYNPIAQLFQGVLARRQHRSYGRIGSSIAVPILPLRTVI